MRLVEIRLLEGPNVYRLEPAVKLEVAVGRRRSWSGQRSPASHALVRLAAPVPAGEWPGEVTRLVAWLRRLRREHGEGSGGLAVHRSSDPGHWIVTYRWRGAERSRAIAEAALELAEARIPADRRGTLTTGDTRLIRRLGARIDGARVTPPTMLTDADRRMPVISITGTNGKSTVTRLVTHILVQAGRHVGTTTSDGILVDERLVEAGDWTGPGGAAAILGRGGVDVAVLETARGGLLLRGVGYASNEASILTNISSDHLDLQGIHTLPELTEVKAVICRITKADGWVVLNADDRLVTSVARRVRGRVAFFSMTDGLAWSGRQRPRRAPGGPSDAPAVASIALRRHLERGGRAFVVRRGRIVEIEGGRATEIVAVAEVPITIGGIAAYNTANALAAAAGARAMGATIEEVAHGLRDFRPSAEASPGRLNLFRLGQRIVIIDFAHNEAGIAAVLGVAEGIAAGAAGRAAPITAIIGTAGDRPDDTLRGIGRIAGERAQRVAIKETPGYLRGRSRESIIGELLAGLAEAGVRPETVPIYPSETSALEAELVSGAGAPEGRSDAARVIVLMTHEERAEVFELLARLGARPIDVASELTQLVPRLQERPHR